MIIREQLARSLKTGFFDDTEMSLMEYRPQLLLNDPKRGQKILTNLVHELHHCHEFFFSVAFVTNSGVAALINVLKELESKGVRGKIVASQYQNFTEPKALERLIALKNLEVRIVVENNFHAKGYIFKRNDTFSLIVGSSNLTQDALSYNKEWNIKLTSLENGSLLTETVSEFNKTFENATVVEKDWISEYQKIYDLNRKYNFFKKDIEVDELDENCYDGRVAESSENYVIDDKTNATHQVSSIHKIKPNKMQVDALKSLERLRDEGCAKALLISATGTGKTYLSAFDVMKNKINRFLFIVHRENIARAAMRSFKKVLGQSIKMGLLSGNSKDFEADYIFCTIQTISKEDVLTRFDPRFFNYIVIDESHRAGAPTYQKILNHFKPEFLLGMTATPERTDGHDIFKEFDYNIAYEIRLHRALEERMLCPFHYYCVTDILIDDEFVNEKNALLKLTSEERVDKIIEKVNLYSTHDGIIRGLCFCNSNEVSKELSDKFNKRGFKTMALSGESSEIERENAIKRLESEDEWEKIDYIFTVDIFNEGVDIPKVNQIIMLRPTQSAIIFVQQLGRGLRKVPGKDYLTVIDFIGNHTNNYLVPVALYGDSSYNKDRIRKLISTGSGTIPGASTVNFDKIAKERIFKAIDHANMQLKKDLIKDYDLLKFKLGRIPMMMDFIHHGSRDPKLYADYSKSYFNFISERENCYKEELNPNQRKLLELLTSEILNGKRIEELVVLRELILHRKCSVKKIEDLLFEKYNVRIHNKLYNSIIANLRFEFVTDKLENKLVSISQKFGVRLVFEKDGEIIMNQEFESYLKNEVFGLFLKDMMQYAQYIYDLDYEENKYVDGFILYKKYSRKDVFRILCWDVNPVAQNVGGYIVSKDKTNCPIFVNYHKEEDISSTTKYEDKFINHYTFQWMSKSKRTLESPDVKAIREYRQGLRISLFIKKHNDEGGEQLLRKVYKRL
jgi:superfamily II DNA or RNA helicase/HKD family nuclease